MPIGEDLGRAVLRLETDPTRLREGLATARSESLQTVKSAQAALTAAGAKMTATGSQMTRGITVPVLAAGAAITSVGADFDHTLSQIVGLVGISRDQVNAWRPEIEALAKATGIGPVALAKALYFVASSGIEAGKAMDVLTVAARASEAGMGDIELLADVLTGTMNAYAKSNLTAAHAMDVLVRGIQVGKAEPADFAQALGTVAPVAAQLGVTVEDLVGTMAILSRTNSNTAENATSLGQILNGLLKPTAETRAALDEMHLSSEQLRSVLSEKGLLAVLQLLASRMGDNDEAIAKLFPNIRALRGVLNLTGQDAGAVAEAMAKVADSSGALDDAVKAVADDATVKLNKALASLQVELIVLSSDVLPVVVSMLGGVVSGVHDAVTWFTSLPAPIRGTIVQGLGLLAVLGPLLVILGSLVSATGNVIGGFRAMSTFMSATLIPRMTAFVGLLATQAITGFATAIFATGIPALQRLALALVGVKVAGGPLLLIASAIIAIGAAASGAAPSIDEIKAKLAELESDTSIFRNQKMIDFLKQKILELEAEEARAAAEAKDRLKPWIDAWNTIDLPGKVEGVIGALAEEIRSGRVVVKDGALVMADGIPGAITTKGREAVRAVTKSIADIAREIRASRREIVDAMNAVVDEAYDPLILAADIAATKVELAEQRKIKASKNSTREEKAEAGRRILQLQKDLARMLNEQTQYGTDAERLMLLTGRAQSKELVAGLKSGDKARRAASEAAAGDIASEIIALMNKTKTYGIRTGNSYVDGLIKAFEDRVESAKRAFNPYRYMFKASSPPGPGSPLYGIDRWGFSTGEAWIGRLIAAIAGARGTLRGLVGGLGDDLRSFSLPSLGALAERASRPMAALVASTAAATPAFAMAGGGRVPAGVAPAPAGGDTHYHYEATVEGLLPAKNPFQLVWQMARFQDTGDPRDLRSEKLR